MSEQRKTLTTRKLAVLAPGKLRVRQPKRGTGLTASAMLPSLAGVDFDTIIQHTTNNYE